MFPVLIGPGSALATWAEWLTRKWWQKRSADTGSLIRARREASWSIPSWMWSELQKLERLAQRSSLMGRYRAVEWWAMKWARSQEPEFLQKYNQARWGLILEARRLSLPGQDPSDGRPGCPLPPPTTTPSTSSTFPMRSSRVPRESSTTSRPTQPLTAVPTDPNHRTPRETLEMPLEELELRMGAKWAKRQERTRQLREQLVRQEVRKASEKGRLEAVMVKPPGTQA